MAGPEEHIRRMQAPDPRMTSWEPAKKEGKAMTSVFRAAAVDKNSSASSAKPAFGKGVRSDAANDFRGEQQQHMELRGACLYVLEQGGTSPIPVAGSSPIDGGTDPSNANAIEITLAADTALQFDWQGFDALDGSQRGNLKIHRLLFLTLFVTHNGFKLTLPAEIKWHEGEKPDLTPQAATTSTTGGVTTTTPPTSEHVINLMARRKGIGANAVTKVYGGLWGSNMR